jgi:hypothetical protein
VHLQTFLSLTINQKCQILNFDNLVANERYISLMDEIAMMFNRLKHVAIAFMCSMFFELIRCMYFLKPSTCTWFSYCTYFVTRLSPTFRPHMWLSSGWLCQEYRYNCIMSKIAPQCKNHIIYSGRDSDPSPPSSVVGHERVELYHYTPYGPYGLYRASVELYLYFPYGPYGLYRASVELYLYSPYGPYGLYRASV